MATALRQAIVSGRMAPGVRVNLNALRQEHAISLSPLREAISRLACERLVTVEDQRGFRIAPATRADLVEVEETRADLLALALGLAIERGDIDWESRVLSALHKLRQASGDPSAEERARSDLLSTMVSGCGRPMLLDIARIFEALHLRYTNVLRGAHPGDTPPDLAPAADAAVSRERDLAVALLRRHLDHAAWALLAAWDARTPPPEAPE